jgi:hypothetical protein
MNSDNLDVIESDVDLATLDSSGDSSHEKLRLLASNFLDSALSEVGELALDDGTEIPEDTLVPYCKDILRLFLFSMSTVVSSKQVSTGYLDMEDAQIYSCDIAELLRDTAELL